GVELELFAERDVYAGSASGDGRGHRALECDAIAPYGFDRGGIEELTCAFAGSGLNFFPLNLSAGSVNDLARGRGYFGADAFARNQCHFVCHGRILVYGKRRGLWNDREAAFPIGNTHFAVVRCKANRVLLY